ncbi:hypothetical protein Ssi03_72460 [Sphaerisporangium siamense]|uniref:Uncharacterized protein n=1 Tax=Sphaerisporangium siamense TaxID=795645 RepID=A0A7W7D2X4_9ACTN|nr:hypothetical protein [Sphaerisporangium siamense]MBB4699345.1 hypothetical protein [Sphaerisporangium siamense]GII89256.1 hypothetical protein Ssi03_72460 [Sphaerisporangium siamense]
MIDDSAVLPPVSVEVLALRVNASGTWAYRRSTTAPVPGESPDEAARRLARVPADVPYTVVHSTSWRYRPVGQVVLTYAVCPDPTPELPAIELPVLCLSAGATPAAPTPEHLDVANVAAHAIRHLAFLKATDAVVGDALGAHPRVGRALDGLAEVAAVAGQR